MRGRRAGEGAQRRGTEAHDVAVLLQAPERLEDHAGLLLEELLVAHVEVQVHHLEVVVELA